MIKIFKKLSRWINGKLYRHYMKKARKRYCKLIGARKYLPDKKMKLELNAAYGKSCYADTDSVGSFDMTSLYPSVMRTGKFPLKNSDN